MYSPLKLGIKYLRYYLTASNGKGHGIHSPFVYDLVTKVLKDRVNYEDYSKIEFIRKELLQNKAALTIEDFGAGSRTGLTRQRTVQQIAASSLKKPVYAQLLYRMVKYFQPQNILELGTSLGITTAYLASAKKEALVTTMEGAPAIAEVAKLNFQHLGLQHINIITGNFDTTLPAVLNIQHAATGFVFIDGNHRKEPTLHYFQQLLASAKESTVLVFDDIHWSEEMEEAWEIIRQDPSVTLTIDLFFIGLVFFRKEQKEKEHFVIRF